MTAVLIIAAIVAVVALVVLAMPDRLLGRGHGSHTGHDQVDVETDSYRRHPPGGGTGGL